MTENRPVPPAQLSREPHLIRIDPEARYILLLRFPAGVSEREMADTVQRTSRILADWWDTQSPYLVLGHTERIAVVLGRLDGVANPGVKPDSGESESSESDKGGQPA